MQRPNQNRLAVRAVLSGSSKRDAEGLQMAFQSLKDQGISILSPANLTASNAHPADIEGAHLLAIKNANFLWLHAPEGYVGTSGALEIGFAHAHGVPVFTTTELQDIVLRSMVQQVPLMKFGVYTGLVVRDHRGHFLTLHFSQKKERNWRFAGGKVEPGEMLIVAAARELQEELGVEAVNLRLVTTQTEYVDGGIWIGFFFEADAMGQPEIKEPHKHDEIAWLTSTELRQRDSHPEWEVAAALESK